MVLTPASWGKGLLEPWVHKMGCAGGGGDSGDMARAGGMGKGSISSADREHLSRGQLVISPNGFQNCSLIKPSLKSAETHEGAPCPGAGHQGSFPCSPESSEL